MKEFYRQYHEYEYHPHAHWAAFIATAFIMTFAILGTIHDVYDAETVAAAESDGLTLEMQSYFDVSPGGRDSTYMRGLAIRRVGGELRFLSLTHKGTLIEFTESGVTAQWDIVPTGAYIGNPNGEHTGIWYEQDHNRLWLTTGVDYTATNHPARVTLISLGQNGSATKIKQFFLDVTAKRVYGGCQKTPSSLVSQLGGPYVCGWGGYTSLIMNGGSASLGPTMYAIPDPDTIADGATVHANTVLDAATSQEHHGVRLSWPLNYFDGGDTRPNGSGPGTNGSMPDFPPNSTAGWLSPNADGLGYMVWGDTYRQTGFWVGTTFAAIPTLCGVPGRTSTTVGDTVMDGYVGICWYGTSAVRAEDRMYELHTWDGTKLGNDRLRQPDTLDILNLPRGNSWSSFVDATYDEDTRTLYVAGFGSGSSVYDIRVYKFKVSGGTLASDENMSPEPDQEPEPEPEEEPEEEPQTPAQNPSPAGNGTGLLGEYYDSIDFTGTKLTRTDSAINFNWDLEAPFSQMGTDYYSVRWTGQIEPRYSDYYTFTINSDDGVRLWVNGSKIIDDWSNHAARDSVSSQIYLEAGEKYDIRLDYYDHTYQGSVVMYWESTNQSKQIVPVSQLYPAEEESEPEAQAPKISGTAVSVKRGDVIVTWNTDIPATAMLQYGKTASYGSNTSARSSLATSHSRTISGLSTGTYHVRAVSTASDMAGYSSDISVIIRGKPSKIQNVNVREGSIILEWPQQNFAGYVGVAILRSTDGFITSYDEDYLIHTTSGNTFHDENVVPGVTYYYSLFTYDDQENYSDPTTVSFVAPEDEEVESSSNSSSNSSSSSSSSRGGGGGGGGGSSSGSSSISITTLPSNFSSLSDTEKVSALLQQISALQSLIASLSGGSYATTGSVSPVSCNFSRSLHIGLSGDDVLCLQRFLNASGFAVASSGAGSPGFESRYFGPATLRAVARWQEARGVYPAAGYFGPISISRYKLQ